MQLITDGQKFALVKLCSQFTKLRQGRLYLLTELIGRQIVSTSDVLIGEWRKIRDEAYPNWSDDNWSVCDEFTSKCQTIISDFEKEILGQQDWWDNVGKD